MTENFSNSSFYTFDNEQVAQIFRSPNSSDFVSHNVEVISSPFKVVKVKNVLQDKEFIHKLTQEALSLTNIRKVNDLYSLTQSIDLNNSDSPFISKYITFMKKCIRPSLEKIFGYKFDKKISITASLYEKTDVLLCHDDKCEDRCIAFVYYLTQGSSGSGGSFDMFAHNEVGQPTEVVHSIPTEVDSFICFEVGNYTYHQVAEVREDTFQRVSLNGWFHCSKALSIVSLDYKDRLPQKYSQILLKGLVMFDDFLDNLVCTPSYVDQVRETFEQESHIQLTNFFQKNFFKTCAAAIKSSQINWILTGPVNRRNYEIANLEQLPECLKSLLDWMKSSLFISYLRNITGLSLEPLTDSSKQSSDLILELQRWKTGCYTMATDTDTFFDLSGLDVYVFFNSNIDTEVEGGYISYLASDDDTEDSELLTIEPVDNAFCAVYRTSDTVRFMKYVNSNFTGTYYCLCATYYEVC